MPVPQTVSTTGSSIPRGLYHGSTAGLAAGTYHIYAQISDLAGHVRYAYLPTGVTLINAPPTPTVMSGEIKTGTIAGDFDVYTISGNAAGSIVLSAGNTYNSSDLRTRIQLFSPTGQQIGTDQLAPSTYGGVATLTATNLSATGIYYAVVSSGDTGNYTFAAANTLGAPNPVASGQAVTGTISGGLSVYTISGNAAGSIVLSAGNTYNSSDLRTRIQLFSPTGQQIGTDQLAPSTYGGVATLTATNLSATGIYYAVVSSGDGDTGNYTFSAASAPGVQLGGTLVSNQMVSGTISGELDSYTILVATGANVTLTMSALGSSMRPKLSLFGLQGQLLATNTASSDGGTATLSYNNFSSAGTYVIVASSGDGDTGNYKLSATGVVVPTPIVASTGTLVLASPLQLRVQLSADVSASLQSSDLKIIALPGGSPAASAITVSFDPVNNIAIFSLPLGFPNGNYRATLTAGSVSDATGNTLAADFSFDFFVLAGDANRDRSVGFADLVAVAQNYGLSNKSWSDGDFNGDGKVDFADLVIVAQQYGTSIPAPSAPVAAPAAAMVPSVSGCPIRSPAYKKPIVKTVARPSLVRVAVSVPMFSANRIRVRF